MIETFDLSKRYGDFWAVNGVTLKVEPGQVLAILGQNGAGKTTTVRMLTALLRPTRGSAMVAGFDVIKDPISVRASIGVLTEQHGLYNRMTGLEYLEFFGQMYKVKSEIQSSRIENLLDYFNLAQASSQRIGEYSKGMKQKLALARALIHEPPVLLLDEPTSAMDPEAARLVRDEIANLRSSKRTIIICTHNLTEAELLADKIAIIYRGKILVEGTLDQLRSRIFGGLEYEVVMASPWNGEGLALSDEVKIKKQTPNIFRFKVKDPDKTNPILVRELVSRNIPVISIQQISYGLEDVYLEVMNNAVKEDAYA